MVVCQVGACLEPSRGSFDQDDSGGLTAQEAEFRNFQVPGGAATLSVARKQSNSLEK